MDRNNPYGMRGAPQQPNGMGMGQPQQRQNMIPQQHYMNEMMYDPMMQMPMTNGMYHHPAQHHPHAMGQRMVGGHMNPMMGMVTPEDDSRFVDELIGSLVPGDLGDPMVDSHLGQMPSTVYDQPHVIPRQPQHQVRAQPVQMQQPHIVPPQQQQQARMAVSRGMGQQPNMAPPSMHQMPTQVSQMPPTNSIQPVSRMPQQVNNTATALARRQLVPPAPVSASSSSSMSNGLVQSQSTFMSTAPPSKPSSVDSRALASTSSMNAGSSDEEFGMGEEDSNKKKERRRQQVRYASRRRRKKQKDEESFLRDRIEELKEQIRIIGGDLSEQCSQMAGMSEQALTEAYEKQMLTVQSLRKDNNVLKEQLLQHENFARMIQYGLNALPSDCRDVDRKKIGNVPMWFSDQMNPMKGPTLVVDLNLCHDAVRQAYNELKGYGPSVNSKTNVCYAMGWKTELWASGTSLSFRAVRTIGDKNIREVANASWDIITSPEKCKRIYPDVKQFRVRLTPQPLLLSSYGQPLTPSCLCRYCKRSRTISWSCIASRRWRQTCRTASLSRWPIGCEMRTTTSWGSRPSWSSPSALRTASVARSARAGCSWASRTRRRHGRPTSWATTTSRARRTTRC